MKIYLDVSCLNRPFDDQSQPRIRLEAEAVELILQKIDDGHWHSISSEMAVLEVEAISDPERRRNVQALLPDGSALTKLTKAVRNRAKDLASRGFKPAAATHIAAAEEAAADVFLTCDDRLLKTSRRQKPQIRVQVANPLAWLEEQQDDSNA